MTTIKVTCSEGHTEVLVLHFNLGPYAKDLAEILAGTSPLFDAKRPKPSLIGKCCHYDLKEDSLCGEPLTCEVVK